MDVCSAFVHMPTGVYSQPPGFRPKPPRRFQELGERRRVQRENLAVRDASVPFALRTAPLMPRGSLSPAQRPRLVAWPPLILPSHRMMNLAAAEAARRREWAEIKSEMLRV